MEASQSRDPFGVALGAIRQFAGEGRFESGAPLVVTDLAAEVGLSATPMREALACLAGEGLIDRRRGRGYFYPELGAADLIDLYELQRSYIHAALYVHPPGSPILQRAVAYASPDAGVTSLISALLDSSGNRALIRAHHLVVLRLTPALQAERRLGEPSDETLAHLFDQASSADVKGLLDAFAALHTRRCANAWRIAQTLRTAHLGETGRHDAASR